MENDPSSEMTQVPYSDSLFFPALPLVFGRTINSSGSIVSLYKTNGSGTLYHFLIDRSNQAHREEQGILSWGPQTFKGPREGFIFMIFTFLGCIFMLFFFFLSLSIALSGLNE